MESHIEPTIKDIFITSLSFTDQHCTHLAGSAAEIASRETLVPISPRPHEHEHMLYLCMSARAARYTFPSRTRTRTRPLTKGTQQPN